MGGGSDGPLRTPATDTDPLTYDITPADSAAGCWTRRRPPKSAKRDLAIPRDIDRRVLAKAQQFGGGLTDPQEKIERGSEVPAPEQRL